MMRSLVRALVQNATVTHAAAEWPASLRVDGVILRAAEILPAEEVEIVNVTTGERFRSWAEALPDGCGEVRVHAAPRHPVRAGDVISIVAFGYLHDGQTLHHRAKVVTLDAANRLTSISDAFAQSQ
jgi:aspartate 1-decarboxylase